MVVTSIAALMSAWKAPAPSWQPAVRRLIISFRGETREAPDLLRLNRVLIRCVWGLGGGAVALAVIVPAGTLVTRPRPHKTCCPGIDGALFRSSG